MSRNRIEARGGVDLTRSRRKPVDVSKIDRLPPHSIEGEQGILGSIFLLPAECMPEAIEKITPEAMYDLRHRTIFKAMIDLFDNNEPIDNISVSQLLKDRHQLEAVGGGAFLSSLPDRVPSAANMGFYLNVVREKFILRRMIQVCTGVIGRIYEHEGEVEQLLGECEAEILGIANLKSADSIVPIKELVRKAMANIEHIYERQGACDGIPTGFVDYDSMTGGMHAGEMIVIGGRPSAGKTSWCLNVAENVAADLQLPVGVFSLEMTAEALVQRMVCSRARVNYRNLQDGFLSERDFPKLTNSSNKLSKATIYIDDASALTIMQVRARARRMVHQFGIKLFVVDYLQQMRGNRRTESRQQEIAEISGGLKTIAKELKVPIMVACQLNRESEKENRKPRMSDLRESGAIEADADIIGLLYKVPQEEDEQNGDFAPVNLSISKHRNGPTGEVHLTFLKGITRFESAAKVSDSDVPKTQSSLPYADQ